MTWYFYVGLIASAGISIFTLPQLITLIKTKNTAYINIPMYAIYLVGCTCFFIGGCLMAGNHALAHRLESGLPLIIAQGICGIISSIIFVWKLKNHAAAKKAKLTEVEYCKKFKMLAENYRQDEKSLSKQEVEQNKTEVI